MADTGTDGVVLTPPAEPPKTTGCCCCKSEIDPEVQARAAQIVAEDDDDNYAPTGSGRIPGSKFTITEIEINDCDSPAELKHLVARHLKKQRGGCCGRKAGPLKSFKYIDSEDPLIAHLDKYENKYFPAHVEKGSDPSMYLELFLGKAPSEQNNNHEPPNANAFIPGQDEHNVLAANRKKLIIDVYNAESPPFKVKSDIQKVELVDPPNHAEIDGWSKSKCRKELTRRGYVGPPYNLKVRTESGSLNFVSIKADSVVCPPKTWPSVEEQEKFTEGMPKVKKMSHDQMKNLLQLVSRDPRFEKGQPVVQPAYYERSCQNIYCCGLFWLYWIGMLVLAGVAFATGDPYRLVRPTDYQGNTCGGETNNLQAKELLYFPRLAEDAFALYKEGSTTPACQDTPQGCFYGVCVESCPVINDIICNYEAEAEIATITDAARQTLARQARANSREGCYVVQMKQIEVLSRCMPYAKETVETEYACATEVYNTSGHYTMREPIRMDNCGCNWNGDFPACPTDGRPCVDSTVCTGTRACNEREEELKLQNFCTQGVIERTQVSSAVYTQGSEELTGFLTNFIMYAEGLMRDVANCWFVILALGPVASGIISFFFILFMSCFAGVLIWWTLFCVFVVLVVASVFFAWQAGYLDDVIAEMTSSNTTDLALINQTLDVVDVAESATSYLEQYMPFGETDEDAAESLQVLWAIAFWTTSFLSLLYVCVVCALTSQIKLAIELIKEAGRTVRKMKTLLLYPFFTYFWVFVLFVYFVGISLFIMSSTADVDTVTGLGADLVSTATDSFTGNNSVSVRGFVTLLEDSSTIVKDFSATNSSETATIDTLENDTFVQVMFVYHLFGYLWTVEFIKAIGMITIAGAIASDYWIADTDAMKPSFPMFLSFWRAIRYHAGSAVYGAFIIAIVRLIRYIMMYVDRKTAEMQKNSRMARIMMCIVHCCLWCLEKVLRYITEQAYILIAIEGRGFCASAWRSFKLLFSASLRIATTQMLAYLVILCAMIGISLSCTAATVLILKEVETFERGDHYVDTPLFPAFLVMLTAGFVSYCFMQVYSMAISTILLSFCLDEDKFKNGLYKKKLGPQGEPDGRMFCVANKKVGLMTLVSKSVRKEQEAMMAADDDFEAAAMAFQMKQADYDRHQQQTQQKDASAAAP